MIYIQYHHLLPSTTPSPIPLFPFTLLLNHWQTLLLLLPFYLSSLIIVQKHAFKTIEDLESMLAYVKTNKVQAAAVIGGGLLGLEAAKAVADMNVKSHIIEFAPILMCRQVRYE